MVKYLEAAVLSLVIIAMANVTWADDRIELLGGDVLIGRIVERTDTHVMIEHSVLGTLAIPRDRIASVSDDSATAAPGDAPAVGPAAAPVAPPPVAVAEDAPSEPDRAPWLSQINIGFAGSQGNSESFDLRAAFVTTNETDRDRWRFDAAYFYGESGGTRNKNDFTAGVLKDWLMPDSPWLYFATGRFDYDEFRTWTYRASGHGGAGYEFLKTDRLTLIGRIGAGAAKEWRPASSVRPEGLLGGELVWNINERQRLTAHTTLFPDLGDFFEFRVVSGVAWNMTIDTARGIGINFGIDNEYESRTAPGIKNNDLKFYGGLTFSF